MNVQNAPSHILSRYVSRGSYRVACSTGAVTTIAAGTATAGQLLNFRNPSSTVKVFVKRVAAKFILTTAYGTAQETGCDLIIARSFSVNGTNGTAIDAGSSVADTGNLAASQPTSVITAGCVRTATTAVITAGTHTLDGSPISIVSGWSGAIGDMVPGLARGVPAGDGMATLFDADLSTHKAPIVLAQDEGLIVRNLVLMGPTGVGRWDFLIEWDEGALLD